MHGAFPQFPDLLATVRDLQQKVAALEEELARSSGEYRRNLNPETTPESLCSSNNVLSIERFL